MRQRKCPTVERGTERRDVQLGAGEVVCKACLGVDLAGVIDVREHAVCIERKVDIGCLSAEVIIAQIADNAIAVVVIRLIWVVCRNAFAHGLQGILRYGELLGAAAFLT